MATALWSAVRAALGDNDAWLFATSFVVVHNAAFYGYSGFLYLIQRKQWLQQYKVEPGKMPPEALQRSAFRELVVSHFLLNPFLVYYGVYPMLRKRLDFGPTLPPLWQALAHLVVFVLCEDTTFYWSHRLLHHRLVYKYIHKRHHEFKYNIGIAAEYDHPVEVVAVFLCTLSGLLFIKPHVLVFFLWLFIRVTEAVDGHSGYRFPWSPFQLFDRIQGGAQRHEFHHSHNIGAFGSWFCFWDWLMGTDVAYRAYQITQTREVHRRFFSERTRKFTLDLADQAQHSMAAKLHAHVTATAPELDTWTNVTLNGKAVPDWATMATVPDKGTLSFVVKQRGFLGGHPVAHKPK